MIERRSEQRFGDIELVMISWRQEATVFKQLGNVEDVSGSGMGVLVDYALPPGTAVSLSYGSGQLEGVVRHHLPHEDRYLLGIQFAENSRNSSLHFEPEFLIGL